MTLVQSHGCLHKKYLSIALLDSSLLSKSEFSNQPTKPLSLKFFVAVVPITALFVFKYTEENLQQIFKIVLKAWAPTISEEP